MTQSLHFCCGDSVNAGRNLRGSSIQFYWAALLLLVLRRGSSLTKASPVPRTELSAWEIGLGLALAGPGGSGLEFHPLCQPRASLLSGNNHEANYTQGTA